MEDKTSDKRKEARNLSGYFQRLEGQAIELPEGYTLAEASHGHAALETVRTAEYRGRKIKVTTTYTMSVDGKPLEMPIHVTDDGHVMTHGMPNYSFRSAIDLVKEAIDTFDPDCDEEG